jgi:hypothetical protein
MVAVPYRTELRRQFAYRVGGVLVMFAVAFGLIAVAGRLDDLDLSWSDAIWIPVAVLVATAIYARLGQRLGEQLAAMEPLAAGAQRVAPGPVGWAGTLAKSVGAGLIIGGLALLLKLDADGLALVLAVALGGYLGDVGANAVRVARHERSHRRTVYRVEDPPGTEAGLRWEPA